jgi:hypothetical protein
MGTRACPRGPRDPGLPFRLAPGNLDRLVRATKNPPEPGSGGSVNADGRFRLGKIAPKVQACAIAWRYATQQFDDIFNSVLHRFTRY